MLPIVSGTESSSDSLPSHYGLKQSCAKLHASVQIPSLGEVILDLLLFMNYNLFWNLLLFDGLIERFHGYLSTGT